LLAHGKLAGLIIQVKEDIEQSWLLAGDCAKPGLLIGRPFTPAGPELLHIHQSYVNWLIMIAKIIHSVLP